VNVGWQLPNKIPWQHCSRLRWPLRQVTGLTRKREFLYLQGFTLCQTKSPLFALLLRAALPQILQHKKPRHFCRGLSEPNNKLLIYTINFHLLNNHS
jgi:hypothetical protein